MANSSYPWAENSSASGPRFDQRSVHGEVFVGKSSSFSGACVIMGGRRTAPRHCAFQQPVPVLREHGRVPYRLRWPNKDRQTSGTAGCIPTAPSASARCGSSRATGATVASATIAPAESNAGPFPCKSRRTAAAHSLQRFVHHHPMGSQRVFLRSRSSATLRWGN